jgi:hypothetical protein
LGLAARPIHHTGENILQSHRCLLCLCLDASSSETRIGALTRCHPVRRASAAGERYGPRPGGGVLGPVGKPGSLTTRCTTSLFQMNNTMIAPSVAAMKPAP